MALHAYSFSATSVSWAWCCTLRHCCGFKLLLEQLQAYAAHELVGMHGWSTPCCGSMPQEELFCWLDASQQELPAHQQGHHLVAPFGEHVKAIFPWMGFAPTFAHVLSVRVIYEPVSMEGVFVGQENRMACNSQLVVMLCLACICFCCMH